MRRWEFMREWWGLIRSAYASTLTSVSPVGLRLSRAGILVPFPFEASRAKEMWLQTRDALELVFLQNSIDPDAFSAMAAEFTPIFGVEKQGHGDCDPYSRFPASIQLLLLRDYDRKWVDTVISALLEPAALAERSKEFIAAHTEVMSVATEQQANLLKSQGGFKIDVHLVLRTTGHETSNAAIECLARLKKQRDESTDERSVAYPFQIGPLDVELPEMTHPAFTAGGLPIGNVRYVSAVNIPVQDFAALTQELVKDTSRGRTFILNSEGVTIEQFIQIFSAISVSTAITELEVFNLGTNWSMEDRRLAWMWLVHSIFSSTASHQIERVLIVSDKMTSSDIACFEQYNVTRNSTALVSLPSWGFANRRSIIAPAKRVHLAQGTTVALGCESSLVSVVLPKSGSFEVTHEFPNKVWIIVPGFGLCSAKISDVIESADPPVTQTKLTTHSIRSLTVAVHQGAQGSQDDMEADDGSEHIARMLELLGEHLRSLTVSCRTAQAEEFLDQVWQHCPQLESLQLLSGRFDSLAYFVNAYESGQCVLQSLRLEDSVIDDIAGNEVFMNALADPNTKIASTLRELEIQSRLQFVFVTDREVENMVNLFRTNTKLQYFAVDVPSEEMQRLTRLFEPYNGARLPEAHNSAMILGFLSVLRHKNASDTGSLSELVGKLDAGILSKLFEFAVSPSARKIVLRDTGYGRAAD